jgi:PAS domain S-box-containing protein
MVKKVRLPKSGRTTRESGEETRSPDVQPEGEQLFWTALERFPGGVVIVKGDKHLYANRDFAKMFGFRNRQQILGTDISTLIHPDDRERVIEFNRRRQQGLPAPEKFECKVVRQNGEAFYVEVTAASIQYEGETMSLVFSKDITDRKRTEESLRESELQKSAILDASFDRIRYVDKHLRIVWSNRTTVSELRMSPKDSVGRACYEVSRGRKTPCEGCPTVKTRQTGRIERAIIHQVKERTTEGELYWDMCCIPLKKETGELVGFLQIARNITGQRRAEERIHVLGQDLLRAQEDERQRMSLDLHDHIAQDLSSMKISWETLFDDYPATPVRLKKRAANLSEGLQRCISAVRDMAYRLRPPELDQMGLAQAVEAYCQDFSGTTGLSVDFHSSGMDKLRLPFELEINLYRLVQEALSNVRKHALAASVSVGVFASFPKILVFIEDNGRGFDVEERMAAAIGEKRMGLHSMAERARLLQGTLQIISRRGQGTKVVIEVPYGNGKKA